MSTAGISLAESGLAANWLLSLWVDTKSSKLCLCIPCTYGYPSASSCNALHVTMSPLWLRGFARPRFTLNDPSGQISSKLQQLPSNRPIQTFAWTRRPKVPFLHPLGTQ